MSNQPETRSVTSLRTGTKVALITALCLLATSVYFFVTPTHFVGKDGGLFGCGSPMSPNDSALGKAQCGILEKVSLYRALLCLAAALIIALLGFLLFGSDTSQQSRADRRPLDDEDDSDDADVSAPRRSGLLAGREERSSRRARLGDEDAPEREERGRRSRLGDEDEEHGEREARPAKVRARLSDDDDERRETRSVRRVRLDDEDEDLRDGRPRRRGRYDDDAFDSARD